MLQGAGSNDARQMIFAVLRSHSHSIAAVAETNDPQWVTFVRNTFTQLIDVIPTDTNVHLCSAFIHFEFHHGLPNTAEADMMMNGRQAAKKLMGQQV